VSGDYQARFYEGLGVKFPRSTLQKPTSNEETQSEETQEDAPKKKQLAAAKA
jgi:hypothetical protein